MDAWFRFYTSTTMVLIIVIISDVIIQYTTNQWHITLHAIQLLSRVMPIYYICCIDAMRFVLCMNQCRVYNNYDRVFMIVYWINLDLIQ